MDEAPYGGVDYTTDRPAPSLDGWSGPEKGGKIVLRAPKVYIETRIVIEFGYCCVIEGG